MMAFNYVFAYGQANSSSCAGPPFLHLIKALENTLEFGGWNAGALVGYADNRFVSFCVIENFNDRANRGVSLGII